MRKLSFFALILLTIACGNNTKVIDDFGDASFHLVDQDSNKVIFPDDFRGEYVVIGFIYTHCPDICTLITQNLVRVKKEMNHPQDIHFVAASFDPKRDTPSALKKYAQAFDTGSNFTFLTGDSTEVQRFLDSARVRTQISITKETGSGEKLYFLNHSDKIMVLDKKSRVVFEYGGSMTKPKYIIEDLNKIR